MTQFGLAMYKKWQQYSVINTDYTLCTHSKLPYCLENSILFHGAYVEHRNGLVGRTAGDVIAVA